MGFDIGKMEIRKHSESGVDFQLEHPIDGPIFDSDGKPLTINLSGADCARIKAVVRERERKKKETSEPGKPAPEMTDEEREAENIADLVTVTNGWSDNWELDGKPFPFSKENASIFFTRFPDIAVWASTKVINRLGFMRGWSKK